VIASHERFDDNGDGNAGELWRTRMNSNEHSGLP